MLTAPQSSSPFLAQPRSPLRLRRDVQPVPDWQLFTRILEFLIEAKTPDDITHRAAASLGLLHQVRWAGVDALGDESRSSAHITIALDSASASRDPCILAVELADPTDKHGHTLIQSLMGLISGLHSRAIEAQRLAGEACTDPLTGLWNRRGFAPFVDQALDRHTRHAEHSALMLCDLDHFKGINDALGHAAGDRALVVVADCIRGVIRPSDIAARVGGDEIAILLSGCDKRGASVVADRLQAKLIHANPLALPLTLSIGIVDTEALAIDPNTPEPSATLESIRARLMEAADRALYTAKASGRARAEVFAGWRPTRAQLQAKRLGS